MAQRILSWSDVEALLEHLLPQFYGSFDAMLMIARGGIIPGGMIAERLNMSYLLTADVRFPAESSHELSASAGDRLLSHGPSIVNRRRISFSVARHCLIAMIIPPAPCWLLRRQNGSVLDL